MSEKREADDRDQNLLLEKAHEHVQNGRNAEAEEILNQLVLQNFKKPHVFHLLGTVYHDQGKFNKAVRAFRRALEVDPGFTDSSIGLSIILNDLGQYDEARKVFEEAKAMLKNKNKKDDHYINDRLAQKHDELGELYSRYERWEEALNEFEKSLSLKADNPPITLKAVDILTRLDRVDQAISRLKKLIHDNPDDISSLTRLGKLYYDANQVTEAIAHWEDVLRKDPDNSQVKDYLRLAQSIETVSMPQNDLVMR